MHRIRKEWLNSVVHYSRKTSVRNVLINGHHRAKGTVAAQLREPLGMHNIPKPLQWPVLQGLPDMLNRARGGVPSTEIFHDYYREFGPMFSWNLPNRQFVVAFDPVEAVKVLQHEGSYPYGGAEGAWPFVNYYKSRFEKESPILGLVSSGEDWKKARRMIAPSLVPPKSAKSLIPHIAEAARLSSANVDQFADNFDVFINRVAFDMFAAISLGEFFKTASPPDAEDKHLKFLDEVIRAFQLAGQLLSDSFGQYKSSRIKEFEEHLGNSFNYAGDMVTQVLNDMNAGRLNEYNRSSFMAKLLADGRDLEDVKAAVMNLLQAGVDTTGYITNWLFINLACNPDKQQKLREELRAVLKGGDLTEESLSDLAYLKAVVHESHRLTPPFPLTPGKKALVDLEVGGFTIPAGTLVGSGTTGIQWDPAFVDSPKSFVPERYLPTAVEDRRGSFKEKLDHRLLATPFSAGARMCVGGRVATYELMAITARIVQDWEFTIEDNQTWQTKQFLMLKADPFPKFRITRVSA